MPVTLELSSRVGHDIVEVLGVMRSALGLRYAQNPYRNGFMTNTSSDNYKYCVLACELGYMEEEASVDKSSLYYVVTDLGIKALGINE